MQKVTLSVGDEFKIPKGLLKDDPAYNEIVLREGSRIADNNEDYERGRMNVMEQYHAELEKQKKEWTTSYQKKERELDSLNVKMNKLQESLAERVKVIDELKEEASKYKSYIAELETVQSCTPFLDKGLVGEANLIELANEYLPEFKHTNTSTIPHSGDMMSTGKGIPKNIIWDSKNKKRKPGKEDIEKLDRDMEVQNSTGGILVSWEAGAGSAIEMINGDTERPIMLVQGVKNAPWLLATGFYAFIHLLQDRAVSKKRSYEQQLWEGFVSRITTIVKNDLNAGLSNWRKTVNSANAGLKHFQNTIMKKMNEELKSYRELEGPKNKKSRRK